MRRLWVVALTVLLVGGLFGTANANLVLNSSFETWSGSLADANFTNWSEGSSDIGATTLARTGSYAATLLPGTADGPAASLVSQTMTIGLGTYEFGMWVNLWSASDPTLVSNGDKAGITFNVYYDPSGASYTYVAKTFTQATGWYASPTGSGYETGWFLISGMFDVASPTFNATLNISLQNYSGVDTYARVDDAFLNKVPEPSTLLLLGSGLLGLAGYGRRWMKK